MKQPALPEAKFARRNRDESTTSVGAWNCSLTSFDVLDRSLAVTARCCTVAQPLKNCVSQS